MWTSLIGFMGSGKSTVARLLCQSTGRPLAVSDVLVATAAGRSIADVFAQDGQEAFRSLEKEVLAGLDPGRNLVVDAG
ncbi:shikimate kinase, partial [bacterium]